MIHTSHSHRAYESLLGLVFAGWYMAALSNLTDFEPFLAVPTLTPLVGINVSKAGHVASFLQMYVYKLQKRSTSILM